MVRRLRLDGTSLRLEDFQALLDGESVQLSIAPDAKRAVRAARKLVDQHVAAGDAVYGLTTGFGKLKSVAIERGDLEQLQENLVLSHCCGVGAPMPRNEVRAAQVLRINGLVRGHSGVRLATLEKLVRLFNAGFTPEIPQQGSVGASGDLAPLAHMAAATMGHGRASVGDGKVTSARRALKALGEEPVVLAAKEGLALINGTEIMKGTGVLAYLRACNVSRAADAIAALSIEALFGSLKPFDERLAALKGHTGHARCAANVRACLVDSEVLQSHQDCDRV